MKRKSKGVLGKKERVCVTHQPPDLSCVCHPCCCGHSCSDVTPTDLMGSIGNL